MKKKNEGFIGWFIIGSAIIWGLTGILMAVVLKGTDCYNKISLIFGAAAGIHLILVWGPLAAKLKKMRKENKED